MAPINLEYVSYANSVGPLLIADTNMSSESAVVHSGCMPVQGQSMLEHFPVLTMLTKAEVYADSEWFIQLQSEIRKIPNCNELTIVQYSVSVAGVGHIHACE